MDVRSNAKDSRDSLCLSVSQGVLVADSLAPGLISSSFSSSSSSSSSGLFGIVFEDETRTVAIWLLLSEQARLRS